ncbi:hypothetical protein E5288_WYG014208 [Bos mutus]|uniref:Fucosyltransferase n=1 Tax=Bos mutus TaxID=72004 RepID=A0A6B0R5G3_9CETA|nr:hypothetical protein [Bos mutus]
MREDRGRQERPLSSPRFVGSLESRPPGLGRGHGLRAGRHPGQGSMVRIQRGKLLAFCLCVMATVFLLITLQVVVELGKFEGKKFKSSHLKDGHAQTEAEPLHLHPFVNREGLALNREKALAADGFPIMLWWSPLTGETGRLGQCGADACFFTINRTYLHHHRTKAFLFYGTDFSIDSLPLPRKAHHDWALFHEESPKNNYKLFHQPVITLFNYTATFSRHSHLPLTTQYLEGTEVLTSLRYLVPLRSKNHLRKSLAPLVYVQSDCDPPSDRDSYVRELMTYIEVDSYGECLRNKPLPPQLSNPASMDADGFYRILAQYKFILAFENAVCNDYITEKLWRPLKLGVVPVYYGSPSIADWLPSNRSAILVSEFSHPRELASYIRALDQDDRRYQAYIEWKLKGEISNQRLLTALRERKWGVQDVKQDNYIDAFECMVCTKVWDNIRLREKSWVRAHGKQCPAVFHITLAVLAGHQICLAGFCFCCTIKRRNWLQQFHSEGKTIEISERDARERDARTLLKLGETYRMVQVCPVSRSYRLGGYKCTDKTRNGLLGAMVEKKQYTLRQKSIKLSERFVNKPERAEQCDGQGGDNVLGDFGKPQTVPTILPGTDYKDFFARLHRRREINDVEHFQQNEDANVSEAVERNLEIVSLASSWPSESHSPRTWPLNQRIYNDQLIPLMEVGEAEERKRNQI